MPLLTIAMADVPRADAGLASGIVNTSLQMASAIGIAVLGTVSDERTRTLAGTGAGHTERCWAATGSRSRSAPAARAAALVVALVALRTRGAGGAAERVDATARAGPRGPRILAPPEPARASADLPQTSAAAISAACDRRPVARGRACAEVLGDDRDRQLRARHAVGMEAYRSPGRELDPLGLPRQLPQPRDRGGRRLG